MIALDEIDDLVIEIKETYAEMEKMYAVYLPYFPSQSAKIEKLNQILNSWDYAWARPRHDKEPGKEVACLHNMLDMQSYIDHHRSLRVTYADGMAPMDKHQFTMRMLFRKINQLCHPDKTKKFGRKVVLALRECFDDAHKAYERRDHQQLELSFIRTCYLRAELDRLDASDVKRIQDQLEGLKLDKQGMMMHPLFLVLFNHRLEDFNMAASYFSEFLDAHVVKLNTVIAEMQAKNSSTTQENGAQ